MEMQNSALTHMMTTQTSILEELRDLRRKEDMRSSLPSTTPSGNTPDFSPSNVTMETGSTQQMHNPEQFEMFQGERYYDSLEASPGNVAPSVNPMSYESISNLPVIGGIAGTTQSLVQDTVSYDRTRTSKEATTELFAQRSKGFQMGAVETTGKAIETAGAASGFLVGGLVGGIAVGSVVGGATAVVAGSMVEGAKSASNYQDILRRDGYKAFNAVESTTEYGGVGMKLGDQQELSGLMRDLAVDKFLDDDEVSQILQGSLDNKLLKSVTDVKSFGDKFSNIIDSVKEISLTLNQTIEEAVAFMGEMERRGVGVEDSTRIAASSKVAASFLGVDANEYTQQMMMQTDNIVSGTAMDASNVMESMNYNAYLATAVEDVSRDGDGVNRQYIKNRGGSGAIAGEFESDLRGYFEGAGQDKLLGMFGAAFEVNEEGHYELNKDTLDSLVNSGKTHLELFSESGEYLNSLDSAERAKLARSAGQIFNQSASSADMAKVTSYIQDQFQHEMGTDADPESALIYMGLTGDDMQARVYNEMLLASSDPYSQRQFASLTIKEEMDAVNLANSPGFFQRIENSFKRNITNPIGDAGQGIFDTVGSISQDLQMTMAGIEKSEKLGGGVIDEITREGLEEMYYGEESSTGKIQELLEVEGGDIPEVKDLDKEGKILSQERFDVLTKKAEKGLLTGSEFAQLREDMESGVYAESSIPKLQHILDIVGGEFEGFGGSIKKSESRLQAMRVESESMSKDKPSDYKSIEDIKKEEENLKKSLTDGNEELVRLLASGKDIGVSVSDMPELEKSVLEGDLEKVKSMTSDEDVLRIAEGYSEDLRKSKNLGGSQEEYLKAFGNAQGVIKMTGDVFDFLEASGGLSEEEIDQIYSSEKKVVESAAKRDLKKLDGYSDEMRGDRVIEYYDKGLEIFGDASHESIAEYLVAQTNGAISMNDLVDESTGEYDVEKLFQSYLNLGSAGEAGESAAEGAILDGKEAKVAAEDHVEAMDSFIAAFSIEARKMHEAVENMQNGNYRNVTSINS